MLDPHGRMSQPPKRFTPGGGSLLVEITKFRAANEQTPTLGGSSILGICKMVVILLVSLSTPEKATPTPPSPPPRHPRLPNQDSNKCRPSPSPNSASARVRQDSSQWSLYSSCAAASVLICSTSLVTGERMFSGFLEKRSQGMERELAPCSQCVMF